MFILVWPFRNLGSSWEISCKCWRFSNRQPRIRIRVAWPRRRNENVRQVAPVLRAWLLPKRSRIIRVSVRLAAATYASAGGEEPPQSRFGEVSSSVAQCPRLPLLDQPLLLKPLLTGRLNSSSNTSSQSVVMPAAADVADVLFALSTALTVLVPLCLCGSHDVALLLIRFLLQDRSGIQVQRPVYRNGGGAAGAGHEQCRCGNDHNRVCEADAEE